MGRRPQSSAVVPSPAPALQPSPLDRAEAKRRLLAPPPPPENLTPRAAALKPTDPGYEHESLVDEFAHDRYPVARGSS
ncbi:MAG TPA: hypothetical protein VLS51_11750, partial [Propionibacteriaceae bacterium]|nr:hypothetical protein [Propionibacteriaceae bacterium]